MATLMAMDVARYAINKCTIDEKPISNLQLQKILYYLQVHFLQKKGRELFTDEIQAWQFGPVVHEVYNRFCGFGAVPLTIKYDCLLPLSMQELSEIDAIICAKRDKWPWALVEETHAEGKAWHEVYAGGFGNRHEISKQLMLEKG